MLPWIHRVFSLIKRWGRGTYHGLRRKHVDTYLNEFVFRYNRRFYRHVSMIDPQREPLAGVVEVDQTEIPFRADNSFFDPVKSGKILIAGAVEVIDRGTNQAKVRRKPAKYLDTRSGRIRLAAIPDNSAASIEAFVRANVKPGTTLLTDGHRSYPGLADYRHDPRTVGKMAGHIAIVGAFAPATKQSST